MRSIFKLRVAIFLHCTAALASANAQEYLFSGPPIYACSGVLLDSGGSTDPYGNNEYDIIYVCPEEPGYRVFLNWTLCVLDATNGTDRITIWDGNDILESPMIGQFTGTQLQGQIITASFLNTSGCLTLRFQSYAAGTGDFAATISCQPRLPGEVSITMPRIDTCQAVLYDSGGSGGPGYHGNEHLRTTICPTENGTFVSLDFQVFDLALSGAGDQFSVYDGIDINAPFMGSYSGTSLQDQVITATSSNPTGCLTVEFDSNSADHGSFIANISCGGPCSPPTAQFSSAAADSTRLCPGATLDVDGSASYALSGRTIVGYRWVNNGDLFDTTSVATHTLVLPTGGIYNMALQVIDDLGCPSAFSDTLSLLVSPVPDHGATTYTTVACTGSTLVFDAEPMQAPLIRQDRCLGPLAPVFLPDDVGAIQEFPVLVAGAALGSTITSVDDIGDICVDLEHTYMGDLEISLVCPDGRSVALHQQGGYFIHLGDANDFDNDDEPVIGTCWDYCWNASSTTGTWLDALGNGVPYVANTPQGVALAPGTFTPVGSMEDLIGCPVNGAWKLRIVDLLYADNGFLCNWCLGVEGGADSSFVALGPILGTADPDSSYWTGPSILNDPFDQTAASAVAQMPGLFDYTYTVLDSYGCEHTEVFAVEVVAPPVVDAGPDLDYCADPVQLQAAVVGGSEPHTCTWVLRLTDSAGNTWNGNAHINVVIDGVLTSYTVTAGLTLIDHELELSTGQHILLDYTAGIASNNDNGVQLLNPDGDTVLSFQNGPSSGVMYNEIVACGSGNTQYQWTPSTGLSSIHGFAPFASPGSGTDYVLTATVAGPAGCSGSDTVHVSAQGELPFYVVYDEGAGQFCADVSSFISYDWYRTGNMVAQTTEPCYSATDPGEWWVLGLNDQGCYVYSDTVVRCPTISINYSINSGRISITGEYASESWTLNGQPLPVHSSFEVLYGGLYEVTATTSYGCVMMASLEVNDLPLGLVQDVLFDNWLHIYPVPNNGTFTALVRRATADQLQLSVFDVTGRVLHTQQLPANSGEVRVPIELNLAPGAYFVEAKTLGDRMVQRIVVE